MQFEIIAKSVGIMRKMEDNGGVCVQNGSTSILRIDSYGKFHPKKVRRDGITDLVCVRFGPVLEHFRFKADMQILLDANFANIERKRAHSN